VELRVRHQWSTSSSRVLDHVVDRALHVEGALGQLVVLPVEDLLEACARVSATGTYWPGVPVNCSATKKRLRQEALHLAGALHGQAVLVGELLDAEDGDDVLEVLCTAACRLTRDATS